MLCIEPLIEEVKKNHTDDQINQLLKRKKKSFVFVKRILFLFRRGPRHTKSDHGFRLVLFLLIFHILFETEEVEEENSHL